MNARNQTTNPALNRASRAKIAQIATIENTMKTRATMQNRLIRTTLLMTLAAMPMMAMGLTGCQSRGYEAPPPPPPVRVDSLYDFSGRVAEAIADRIAQDPRIKNSPRKVIVALGQIENRTKGTDTSDFIIIREHLADQLTNSDFFRKQATLIKDLKRFERLKAEFSGGGASRPGLIPDETGNRTSDAIAYDPNDVYVLDGFFGEITRGGTTYSNYFFRATLTHVKSAQEVFSQGFRADELR